MGYIGRDHSLDGRQLKHGDAIRLFHLNKWINGTVDTFMGEVFLMSEHIKKQEGLLLETNMLASFVKTCEDRTESFSFLTQDEFA